MGSVKMGGGPTLAAGGGASRLLGHRASICRGGAGPATRECALDRILGGADSTFLDSIA